MLLNDSKRRSARRQLAETMALSGTLSLFYVLWQHIESTVCRVTWSQIAVYVSMSMCSSCFICCKYCFTAFVTLFVMSLFCFKTWCR